MGFSKFAAVTFRSRAVLALFACVSMGLLGGCGGAWQPDPRDAPKTPARSGIEGSGLTGPEDSRTKL
ncbi:MAG: hypothetical protein DMF06_16690 [Verrucomicrobia bacterium]|nr:MAG: hypothetical protein DMF06_16690 [Verrucomicrobiota bacterium]